MSENPSDRVRGNRTAYLLARLRTQHPDVFARLQRGEFDSVYQAALEAGIRRRVVQHAPDVTGFFRSAQKPLTRAEQFELATRLLQDTQGEAT
jgi:hypothetical protein